MEKNAAELAKKAEKTAQSKSESKKKMGNKAAATAEQAMAKHVFPAKVVKQATPAGCKSSMVARIWPDLARISASLAHLPSLAHICRPPSWPRLAQVWPGLARVWPGPVQIRTGLSRI